MKIERFSEAHQETLFAWREFYEFEPEFEFPPTGFVALDEEGLLAAAFLRKMEGGLGLFDGLIANPRRQGKLRNKAINEVVKQILEEAKTKGLKKVLAYSHDKATLRRSLMHGFEFQPDVVIARKI